MNIFQKNYEGGKIFWRGNATGAAMLFFLGGFYAFGIIGMIIMRLIGASTPGDFWMFQFLFMMFVMTLPFLLGPLIMREKLINLLPFNKVPLIFFIILVVMQLGVGYAGSFVSVFFNFIFESVTGVEPSAPGFSNIPGGLYGRIFYILTIAAAPALAEEFAFRGIILGALRKYGNMNAIVISSLLFGLMHGNMRQIPFTFIFGLAMGLATVLSNSLWPAIVAHFLNNFFVGMLGIASDEFGNMVMVPYVLFMLMMIVAGISALIYLMIKYWSWLKYQGALCYNHWGKRFALLMVNPCMLIAMIVLLTQAALSLL